MVDERERDEWQARKVADWLFLLLRFAITHDEHDRVAVYALAGEMDSIGTLPKLADHGFFLRTSVDVCNAIAAPDNPRSFELLRTHAQRIEHPRLRNCFRTAVDLVDLRRVAADASAKRASQANLWVGLPASSATNHHRK